MALAFLVCFLLAFLSLEAFVITHAEHDCIGAGCPVCARIASAEGMLAQFKTGLGSAVFMILALIASFAILFKYFSAILRFSTPVTSKARMNN